MTMLQRMVAQVTERRNVIGGEGDEVFGPGGPYYDVPFGRSPGQVLATNAEALGIPTVWACVRVVAEDIGSLPLMTYRRDGADRDRLQSSDDPRVKLLHTRPHPDITASEFWESRAAWLELDGNAYAYKQRNRAGRVMALWPLSPKHMAARRDPVDGTYWWVYSDGSKDPLLFRSEEIIHWRGLSLDGRTGLSPITYHRLALSGMRSAAEYGRRFWDNDGRPGGVLESPKVLSDPEFDQLKARWNAGHRGVSRAHETGVLEGGITYKAISISPEDAQLIETRKYGGYEVCQIWRVPPHKVGLLDRATFSNIEHQGIDYVTGSLRARLNRLEQRTTLEVYDLPGDADSMFAEFLVDALLRGDTKARYESYNLAIQGGHMSPNEAARKENRKPVDGGDRRFIQQNMAEITADGLVPANRAPAGVQDPDQLAKLIEAVGALVRAGFDPAAALELVGLDPIEHLGLLPVTLQPPADDDGGQS